MPPPAPTNRDIAAVFERIAELLELQGANRFRIRAYRNAARLLQGLKEPVHAMLDRGEDPDVLPGIGAYLAGKIAEIVHTGSCALLQRLRAETPPDRAALLQLPLLGPQRVRALHEELGIETVEQLHEAAQQGRLRQVHGFGSRLQQQLLEATALHRSPLQRRPLALVVPRAEQLLADLRALQAVKRAEAAVSVRRGAATVGDLDLLVQADDEYGVFRGARQIAGDDEAGVYAAHGLEWIAPALRDAAPATGEAAAKPRPA